MPNVAALARTEEAREWAWLQACRVRAANIRLALKNATTTGGGEAYRLRTELATAEAIAACASKEWSSARRVRRMLGA
jgi:hypothetical protein